MSQYPPPPAPSSQWPGQQPPPPPVYGGGAAPAPIPRYSVQPQPPRRRHSALIVLGVIVGVLVVLVAVGAAVGGKKNGTHVSKVKHPAATGQPAAPAAPAQQPKGEKQFALGETAEITQDGKVAGTITVSDPKATQKAPNEYSQPPAKGWFVTLTVTARATGSGTFDVNPFDFYVRGPDGQHYGYGEGNAVMAGGDGGLDAATLNPGETVKGTVTFDVPDQHGVLVYAPGLGRALGSWTY
jgi:hypothetical protein